MFDHRLGLALGKSIGEIHAMPYPEYHAWELFYLVEPWGWWNEEYKLAALLAMLYNANRGKGKAKEAETFMRDMVKAALDEFKEAPDLSRLSPEEQREMVLRQIRKDFGIK